MTKKENRKGQNRVMYYDYKKRTNGGIVDALFLVAIIVIISTFVFLYLMGGN